MEFKEVRALAIDAYLAIWRSNHIGFVPPPSPDIRDRKWSKTLREYWPNCTDVDVRITGPNAPSQTEMKHWCDGQQTNYWVNGGQNRWYFERREIAVLFKLTFGGAQ